MTAEPLRQQISECLARLHPQSRGPSVWDLATQLGAARQDVRTELRAMETEGLARYSTIGGTMRWGLTALGRDRVTRSSP